MIRSGNITAQYVEPVRPHQIQPNGVDLTGAELYRIIGPGALAESGTTVGEREPVPWSDGQPLPAGSYVVRYAERIRVPEGHVGLVFPRSSLLRNGAMLHTAVWDPGYDGRGEGLLVLSHPLHLPAGMRIGQFVLFTAEGFASYQGQWQGEGR